MYFTIAVNLGVSRIMIRKESFYICLFGGCAVTVSDAVAKRVSKLLAEKGITQYRLEQRSGLQHGHMQWIHEREKQDGNAFYRNYACNGIRYDLD